MAEATAPRLTLLGPPALHAEGAAVPLFAERRHQLLAVLGLRSGSWVDRDLLAGLFWPAHPLVEARRNLRKVIFKARDVPGVHDLQVTDHALCWRVATDVQAFERALREQRHADGVAQFDGQPLAGLADPADSALADWLAAERTRLATAWQHAAHELLRTGAEPADRLALAQRLLAADALDETAVAAIVDSELARGNSAAARRAYQAYAERLAGELGIEPSNALRERLRLAGAAAAPSAPASTLASPGATVAAPAAGGFIGRRSELAEVDALLALPELRLLTLLGPGGVGKSRLARQVLARSARRFGAGAWWVDLQDLGDVLALTARLAQQLGVEINDTRDPLPTLSRALEGGAGQRALLVLDNAEHLPALPAWVDALLAAAPGVTLLVTSRQRLRCAAEKPVPLAGLAVPDEDSRDLEAAVAFDAVRLFDACARRSEPGFDLARHLAPVLELIDAVAGLPLAIELAASWVRLLPPHEMARELHLSIDLLQRDTAQPGSGAARPEHDSLTATLESSWRLLAPREREALSALSVFEGGFTRAAAQAVAQVALPLLGSLFDRSLVKSDESGRFSMHPYAAAWARGKLAEAAARAAELQAAHTRHYARELAELLPLRGSAPKQMVQQMRAEHANWTQAWRHALATGAWDAVRQMLPLLLAFFENEGRWNEGLALLRPAQAAADGDDAGARARTQALDAVATLLYRRGDLDQAVDAAASAVRLAQGLGERDVELTSLNTMGLALWNQGRASDALPHLQRALALARADGRQRAIARALGTLAIAEKALGHFELSLQRQQEVLALQRALGDWRGLCVALNNVGNLHRAARRHDEALPCFEEGLQLAEQHGLVVPRVFHALNLGLVLVAQGEIGRARQALGTAMAAAQRAELLHAEVLGRMALADCDIAEGHFDSAVEGLRKALAGAEAKGFHTSVLEVLAVYARLVQARGDTAAAAVLWAFLSTQPALDEATRIEARERLAASAPGAADRAAAMAQAAGLDIARACVLLRSG